jgi:hypothetical protein
MLLSPYRRKAGFNTFLSLDLPLVNDRYKTLMNPYRSAARVTTLKPPCP